jgi:DinB superfamily
MTSMNIHFETQKFSRTRIAELIDGLSVERLNRIPDGLDHNIIWTIGHILASQQFFMYKRTRLPFTIDAELIMKYRSGTKASSDVSKEEIEYLVAQLPKTWIDIQHDYEKGMFKQFDAFTSKRGVPIATIEDAIAFHTFHEGVHLGWIWMIRKLI